jgi:hypothetical protein
MMRHARALAQLRHLYEQMLVLGAVRDTEAAARGLLGPAIAALEAIDRCCKCSHLPEACCCEVQP